MTALTDSQAAGHLTKLATLDYGENQPNRFHTLSLTFSQSPTISIPLSLTLISLSLISSLFKVTHFPGFSVLFLSSPALFSSAGVSYCTMIPCISGYSPLCWVDIFSAWGPPIIHVLSTREVELGEGSIGVNYEGTCVKCSMPPTPHMAVSAGVNAGGCVCVCVWLVGSGPRCFSDILYNPVCGK